MNNNFTVIIKLWYENDVILTDLHEFNNKTDAISESTLHMPNELVSEYNICISELILTGKWSVQFYFTKVNQLQYFEILEINPKAAESNTWWRYWSRFLTDRACGGNHR